MGHTYYAVHEHIVFSTKHRQRILDKGIQAELFPYLAAAVRNQGCKCLIVGGRPEHVHILAGMSPTLLTAELVKEIKRTSSIWIKGKGDEYRQFNWQVGYGAFSVSYSNITGVRDYIANQDAHHHEMTWEQEFRGLLERHGIEFDERYYLD
jgi:REP element-mobilizing transposase RayT